MNTPAIALDHQRPVAEAAQLMAEYQVGDVFVTEDGQLSGIVTDRDLALRVVAEGRALDTEVREVCTLNPQFLRSGDSLADAMQLMREANVRRLPVVENDAVVGAISLGDIAIDQGEDASTTLRDISASPANN
jgi:signal-transduction protein with cAMP-binding, CBS, and nucleotidyltransferase domain